MGGDKKIRTVVVCKEGNNEVERIEGGVFSYEVEIKALKRYSADEFFTREKVSEVELIFTPLMNSKYSISERIRKSIEKYKEQEKEQSKIIDFAAAILVLSNRIITREEFKEIWEEIKMLNIMKYAEEKVSEVELIFTPLMNSKYSISERIRKSIEKYKE